MEIVVMPKLGFNMDEGKLVSWGGKEGDSIKKGAVLFSIETDKTVIDVESTSDGVIRKQLVNEGDTVPVTLPIAIIADENEDISAALEEALAALGSAGLGTGAPGGSAQPAATAAAPAAPAASADKAPAAAVPAAKPAAESSRDFQLLIIGGGPGGYVAAIRAAQLGLRTAIVEQAKFGGVCLNRGCIPTKTLLRSVEALNEVREAAKYGVTGVPADGFGLDMKKVIARKNAITGELVAGVQGLLKKNKLTVIEGEAQIQDANTVSVAGKNYSCDNLIIATGSVVKELPAGVVQRKSILTSDEILSAEKLPKEIVVIGGGVIGVEFAYFLASAGVRVVIVEFLDRILPPVDAEIAAQVHKNLEEMGVVIHTGAKVTLINDNAVCFEKDGKAHELAAKQVLVAVGRAPNLSAGVEKLGVSIERGAIVTDERMRTNVEGVYAIGDVNGMQMLAHVASAEGIVAVENIAGKDSVMSYDAVPSAIYIQPEIAAIGLTEEDARASRRSVVVGKFPLMANGKSKVAGDSRGLSKVVADGETGEILGVHLYCLHATEMIGEISAAMSAEATTEEIAKAIHPHPTVSEALQEAFHASLGGAIHF
jgi:dihydrolipoamide dehydrogenase